MTISELKKKIREIEDVIKTSNLSEEEKIKRQIEINDLKVEVEGKKLSSFAEALKNIQLPETSKLDNLISEVKSATQSEEKKVQAINLAFGIIKNWLVRA